MPEILHTSDANWLKKALHYYETQTPFELTDDMLLGISPDDLRSAESLIEAVKRASSISGRQALCLSICLGTALAGIWMIVTVGAAPLSTDQSGVWLCSGLALVLAGSLGTLWCLNTQRR
ncbi:MAG: hypothetical protein ACYC2R_15535 [Burkholderiales bacterium]